jgi:hypothetical protein
MVAKATTIIVTAIWASMGPLRFSRAQWVGFGGAKVHAPREKGREVRLDPHRGGR